MEARLWILRFGESFVRGYNVPIRVRFSLFGGLKLHISVSICAAILFSVCFFSSASAQPIENRFSDDDLVVVRAALSQSPIEDLVPVLFLDTIPEDTPIVVAGAQHFTPWKGVEIEKVSVIESGQPLEKYWKELTPNAWRRDLQNHFAQTIVYDLKSGAELNIPTGALSFLNKRGKYNLGYHNFCYKSYPCTASDLYIGSVLVGVGVRIEIDASFKNGRFSLGIPELALSASKNRVSGLVQADLVGLGNSTPCRWWAP